MNALTRMPQTVCGLADCLDWMLNFVSTLFMLPIWHLAPLHALHRTFPHRHTVLRASCHFSIISHPTRARAIPFISMFHPQNDRMVWNISHAFALFFRSAFCVLAVAVRMCNIGVRVVGWHIYNMLEPLRVSRILSVCGDGSAAHGGKSYRCCTCLTHSFEEHRKSQGTDWKGKNNCIRL